MRHALLLAMELRPTLATQISELWAQPWRANEKGPPPLSVREIAERLGFPPASVRRALGKLKSARKLDGSPPRWVVVLS